MGAAFPGPSPPSPLRPKAEFRLHKKGIEPIYCFERVLEEPPMVAVEKPIRFFGLSDVGRRRDHNEDAYFLSETGRFAILADGMGGRHYGEVAANMTVDSIREQFDTFFPPSVDEIRRTDQSRCADMVTCLLDEWIRHANAMVWKKGRNDERYKEMGTTLVMVYALPSLAVVAYIGDSRAYLVHDGSLELVTHDHSFVNSQVASGAMTEAEAQESKQKNIITRAIGTGLHVKPEFRYPHIGPGDRLLLCSDGLTDMVPDEGIQEIFDRGLPAQETCQALVDAANEAGGKDNITVLIVEY